MKPETGKYLKTERGYSQFFSPEEIERAKGLPQDLIDAFEKTYKAQRYSNDCPEDIMREAQRYHSGVMTYVMEEVGDLTHRLTHHIQFGVVYPDLVQGKVNTGIRNLSRGQGFVDEHETNLTNNSEYNNVPREEMENKVNAYLEAYADAHAKVPVYNRIQWYAREAAIQVGRKNFPEALSALQVLNKELENVNTFVLRATMINRDEQGNVQTFEKEDLSVSLEKKAPSLSMSNVG